MVCNPEREREREERGEGMHVFMCAFVYLGGLGWEKVAKEIFRKGDETQSQHGHFGRHQTYERGNYVTQLKPMTRIAMRCMKETSPPIPQLQLDFRE